MILLAMCLMFCQDVLATLLVIAQAHGKTWPACLLDGLKDWPALYGAGISGATVGKYGAGSHEAILVTFVSLTSIVGTRVGMHFGERLAKRE